jgi:1,4-alpha-glucan branching enzyme
LGRLYRDTPALWQRDYEDGGYEWIDLADRDNCVISYARYGRADHVVVVLNLTPVARRDYRIGMPSAGRYAELFSSDRREYGGSEVETLGEVVTDPVAVHGRPQSAVVTLPPLGVLVLGHRG